MLKNSLFVFFTLISGTLFSQVETEVPPPYNIKTVTFVQNGQNTIPIFSLGDSFQLQFDDLFGNEANYYYTITHCDYDWKPSQLSRNEYLTGFDDQRIQDYTNSFNSLQVYSHYRVSFPNRLTQFRVSGNYVLKILNDDKEVVFSRKFILYEELVSVPVQVKRTRNLTYYNQKQNIEFAIKSPTLNFQSPLTNVKVMLMQNGKFDNAITNVKPQYTIGNDLIYKYDGETQFWAGNEFLFFENKDIRAANNSIAAIDSKGGLYNAHLYPHVISSSKKLMPKTMISKPIIRGCSSPSRLRIIMEQNLFMSMGCLTTMPSLMKIKWITMPKKGYMKKR
jgi:Domain of unknown function (DUF5103)